MLKTVSQSGNATIESWGTSESNHDSLAQHSHSAAMRLVGLSDWSGNSSTAPCWSLASTNMPLDWSSPADWPMDWSGKSSTAPCWSRTSAETLAYWWVDGSGVYMVELTDCRFGARLKCKRVWCIIGLSGTFSCSWVTFFNRLSFNSWNVHFYALSVVVVALSTFCTKATDCSMTLQSGISWWIRIIPAIACNLTAENASTAHNTCCSLLDSRVSCNQLPIQYTSIGNICTSCHNTLCYTFHWCTHSIRNAFPVSSFMEVPCCHLCAFLLYDLCEEVEVSLLPILASWSVTVQM